MSTFSDIRLLIKSWSPSFKRCNGQSERGQLREITDLQSSLICSEVMESFLPYSFCLPCRFSVFTFSLFHRIGSEVPYKSDTAVNPGLLYKSCFSPTEIFGIWPRHWCRTLIAEIRWLTLRVHQMGELWRISPNLPSFLQVITLIDIS